MIGHEPTLSRTNSGGVVWVCQCGQIGDVTPMIAASEEITARSQRRLELTQDIARASHGRHLEQVTADVVAQSDAAFAGIGRSIVAANQTLQRRGRWGRP